MGHIIYREYLVFWGYYFSCSMASSNVGIFSSWLFKTMIRHLPPWTFCNGATVLDRLWIRPGIEALGHGGFHAKP